MVSLNYRGIGFLWHLVLVPTTYQTQWATSVGSGTITAKQAIIIALIFESAGAYLAGGEVTETIKSGVIDPTQFVEMPDVLALGMLSALLHRVLGVYRHQNGLACFGYSYNHRCLNWFRLCYDWSKFC